MAKKNYDIKFEKVTANVYLGSIKVYIPMTVSYYKYTSATYGWNKNYQDLTITLSPYNYYGHDMAIEYEININIPKLFPEFRTPTPKTAKRVKEWDVYSMSSYDKYLFHIVMVRS